MEPQPIGHTESRRDGMTGIKRKRVLLASAATTTAALAAACLPLPLAIPLVALTTLIATAVGIGSRLIAINHG